jgi:anaphase-promoting complex subunit 3
VQLIFEITLKESLKENCIVLKAKTVVISSLLFSEFLGAAEEASAFFGEAAALCIQKQYLNCSTSPKLHSSTEDCNLVDTRHCVSEDAIPRQSKLMQGLKDIPGNHHGAPILGGTSGHPINSGLSNISFYNTPSPMMTQVIG